MRLKTMRSADVKSFDLAASLRYQIKNTIVCIFSMNSLSNEPYLFNRRATLLYPW